MVTEGIAVTAGVIEATTHIARHGDRLLAAARDPETTLGELRALLTEAALRQGALDFLLDYAGERGIVSRR